MNHPSTTSVATPPHVPGGLLFDYDYVNDPRLSPDLHEGLHSLMADAPAVFYTPRYGGHWVATSEQAIRSIIGNPAVFSSSKMTLGPEPQTVIGIPINLDPPAHAVYRGPLSLAFSPKNMAALEGSIHELVNELINRVLDQGKCDFLAAIAEPVPVTIFMKMMGMPLDRLAEFRELAVRVLATADFAERDACFARIITAMTEIIVARQNKREDDLISRMLDLKIGDRSPTLEEMQSYCFLLFLGGLDTVVNAMCFGIRHLARDQALQERLRADPSLIRDAVEEILRRYGISTPLRVVTRDFQYGDVPFKAGDMVMLHLQTANLDPKAFEKPESVNLERGNAAAHFTFGIGPHRCAGSHLARLELRVLYREWLRRVPPFKLDPERPAAFHGGMVLTVSSLPLVWWVRDEGRH
ncbi:MAG: cytochrome P450 [Gammaproteobacteria bacterium]|nr:cytochrome P450 [Gammaproteobacteria bacterium]